jgi:hypothetical protein
MGGPTSRERMDAAMRPRDARIPDRVPVMCQLALGHYFLNAGAPAHEIWHDTRAFGDALLLLQRRYGFDGVLVNLPGRDPDWRESVQDIGGDGSRQVVVWRDGRRTVVPPDDNPFVVTAAGHRLSRPGFDSLAPETLFYVEPHGQYGVTMQSNFPAWQWDTVRYVRAQAPDISVHGEVFSAFSQLMELLGCETTLMALLDDGPKVSACLDRLGEGAAALACGQLRAGADAILISSAYAGAGLISRRHYEQFVLPHERQLVSSIRAYAPEARIYTHTCGAIGDRLDVMEATGTDGIDTLDPPPLGTVELAEAVRRFRGRIFIKGNIDPVSTLLRGTPDECYADARRRIETAGGDGGYILSSACSVPPHTPAGNILQLARAAGDAA